MDSELSRVPTKLIQIYTVQLAVSSHYITTSWHLTELFKTAKHLKKTTTGKPVSKLNYFCRYLYFQLVGLLIVC